MASRNTALELKQKIATAIAFCLLVWVVLATYTHYQDQQKFEGYARLIDRLPLLTQQLAKNAQLAASGSTVAYSALAANKAEFTNILGKLDSSDDTQLSSSAEARVALTEVTKATNNTLQHLQVVEDARGVDDTLKNTTAAFGAAKNELGVLLQNMVNAGAPAKKSALAGLTQAIAGIDSQFGVAVRADGNAKNLDRLEANIRSAQERLSMLPAETTKLARASELLEICRDNAQLAAAQSDKLLAAKNAADTITGDSETMLAVSQRLVDVYRMSAQSGPTFISIVAPGILLAMTLFMLAKYYVEEIRNRTEAAMRVNLQNEKSILRLIDELNGLADGDLTMHATVGESITGPIADSVNHTTEVFRNLVMQINSTSKQMDHTSQGGKVISYELMKSARRQTREIQKIGDAVEKLHESIKSVDTHSKRNADRARIALADSRQGAVAVDKIGTENRIIDGLIVRSTKLLTKLSESTRQIAEQIDLIADIAEQTSVMSLNAAIQAASTGGGGRGFAVVAEEVQRLAERSGVLIKHIGQLANSVQNDAREVVSDMEKSKAAVERSDQLTDTTRTLLQELAKSAKELDETSVAIMASTKVQSGKVREMADVMQGVFDITLHNADSSRLTDESISQINRLAEDLRGSVAGFKV
ncbi:MAG: methyl-accepting chemotaxis protein [Gallionella sp.]